MYPVFAPIAAGKPEAGIYHRGAALVGGTNPLAVGDRLNTDIAGAVTAGIPSLHVLTGVSFCARRHLRPARPTPHIPGARHARTQ